MLKFARLLVTVISIALGAGWFAWLGGGSAVEQAARPIVLLLVMFAWAMSIHTIHDRHEFAQAEHSRRMADIDNERDQLVRPVVQMFDYRTRVERVHGTPERDYQYTVSLGPFEKMGFTEPRLWDMARRVLAAGGRFSYSMFTPKNLRGWSDNEIERLVVVMVRKEYMRPNNPREPRAGVAWTKAGADWLNILCNHAGLHDGRAM